ncbi:MAG: polysaccharide deacetylase family protein [Candidatus Peribacter sp.]|jgi:peptidoglycan-N-acetylglucosamine deacetylase|nr:polysaccharide deacetylase family protein [Candidatus Peribacter sp.]MBT4393182.1 polysaccharide deacetylase family protein [Candidatus Peribacter sp.]MBT4600474.1 polysaccharide deacetylase family protein [Candidatus Peribacter sp.]MBT5148550.1 polysaccharide deacetylase family protein [Candidatus Peribacter sp.]MBT5638717.1 polysaccharide deacetylase family protein [Candidatus Peribacter sp.]
MLFTTSWDDGYKLDLRLADLLDQYGCKGTFYVCPRKQHGNEMMTSEEVTQLRERHEIGAHTLRHPKLTEVSTVDAKTEIEESKAWVEQVTGAPCSMFCYPYGFYNDEIVQIVRDAGYKGARTTERLEFTTKDPFVMPTTLHVTPFPRRKTWSRWWHPLDPYGPLRVRRRILKQLGVAPKFQKSWLDLAIHLFDLGKETNQSVFHLWGHSHEIEKYGMWEDLEKFLAHVQKSNVECVVNSKAI